ncbi:grifin [Tupaia chinensis]|uniref:grifin n=1 Tax=Tupaia chinensis TaxID=246437 RepID=UPI0003C8FF11|nr:grifin [Tupaia chinensis]
MASWRVRKDKADRAGFVFGPERSDQAKAQPPCTSSSGWKQMALQFEAFCAGGLAPGWSLLVQGQSDSGEDKFEINFLSEGGDIAFHIKPRFSSATMVGNAFQDGRWGQEEVSSVFPLTLGEPFELEVSSDAEHFHVYAQEHKVLQFPHRQRPLAAITRVRVLSDHRLAQVELAKRGLSWGCRPHPHIILLYLDFGNRAPPQPAPAKAPTKEPASSSAHFHGPKPSQGAVLP